MAVDSQVNLRGPVFAAAIAFISNGNGGLMRGGPQRCSASTMASDPRDERARESKGLNELAGFLVSVKAGEELFRQDDEAHDFFVIKEGSAVLVRTGHDHEQELERLGVGDCLGEAALLGGGRRASTARAVTDCTLVRLELATLAALLKESPGLGLGLLRKLAVRLLRLERAEPPADAIPAWNQQSPVRPTAPAPSGKGFASGEATASSSATAADAANPAQLRHLKSGRLFVLSAADEAIVGRVDRATGFTPPINFSDLDEGRTIGRRHAMIVCRDGDYFVREDAATRNGTFVNGTRLQVKTEQRLANGDRLRFGLIDVVFECD
jgi:pSer/pThr/pTyr-binding forkhead associated (FHA) protein